MQELLVRNKVLVVCLKQQFFFEVIALLGFEIFILLLPLGHTLCEKFLTAQLLRGLGLFNLHLIVVPFLGGIIIGGLHLFEILNAYLKESLLQGFLLAVEFVAGRIKVHLRLSFLGLLLTLCVLDFESGILFEPCRL